jgi:metal-dependent hydrolase (beta-lactamase superfamily II)
VIGVAQPWASSLRICQCAFRPRRSPGERCSDTRRAAAADVATTIHGAVATGAFADNAEALGMPVSTVDTVVMSHGHFDHTGGLDRRVRQNDRATIHAAAAVRQLLGPSISGEGPPHVRFKPAHGHRRQPRTLHREVKRFPQFSQVDVALKHRVVELGESPVRRSDRAVVIQRATVVAQHERGQA